MTEIAIRQQPIAASLPDMVRYAEHLANANLLPGQYRKQPANVLYAMEYGRTLGITPLAAITGIHVIEGKPSASAALISGLVRQAGHKLRVTGNGLAATAQIIRSDDPGFTYSVTWELRRNQNGNPSAEEAGLLNKDVWKKYAASMLKARAISQVARDACEEVLFGLHYTPEELGAQVDEGGEPVDAQVHRLHPTGPIHDEWSTPAPGEQAAPQCPAGLMSDTDGLRRCIEPGGHGPVHRAEDGATWHDSLGAQRDYLHEAYAAPDADAVRRLWLEARADGAVPEYLAQIAAVGRERAAGVPARAVDEDVSPSVAAAAQQDDGGVVDGEVVPDAPADEHAAAVADLRAFAAAAGLSDIDADAHQALGLPLADASAAAIRGLTAQLRGSAA